MEANNLVGQLRDEFINTTKGFKDILKVRSDRMKERSDRQSEFLGFDKGAMSNLLVSITFGYLRLSSSSRLNFLDYLLLTANC